MSTFKKKDLYTPFSIKVGTEVSIVAKNNQNLYPVSIVGIVALVGIVVLLLHGGAGENSLNSSESVTGAVVTVISPEVTSYSFWTTCLDQGNQVKLGDKEGDSLVKKDTCTGSAVRGKQIVEVSCVRDAEGDFSYKYSNPEDCSSGTKCMLDDNGAAYCG